MVAGEPLAVAITASDPGGDPIVLTTVALPAWAALSDNGDGTGTITGTPADADTGTTQSLVTAAANDRTDTEILTITVVAAP